MRIKNDDGRSQFEENRDILIIDYFQNLFSTVEGGSEEVVLYHLQALVAETMNNGLMVEFQK